MIEGLLKKRPRTFYYGTVDAVYETLQQVQIRLRNNLQIRIQTTLILAEGDTVILAENDQDKSKFIVQYSKKLLPATGTLLLV